ncbi:MAG: class I SAM-dependent methyltransferase [Acidobacteria bacterium]|nr:class I SAM-dependent methyltransferase [Acidobacteriota bacterium]
MSAKRLRDRIARRARNVGLDVASSLLDGLETYFLELARWNRKINLTAFQLDDDGTDDAVDRLLIEPLVAAKHIPGSAKTLMDIGSGGGSPAVPMKLARPDLSLTMVEVKVRKSVFLRQVARLLQLAKTEVENTRFEELLARPALHENLDVLSIRAVRIDTSTLLSLQAFIKPGGHLLNFAAGSDSIDPPPPLRLRAVHTLIPENQSRLVVIQKQRIGRRST